MPGEPICAAFASSQREAGHSRSRRLLTEKRASTSAGWPGRGENANEDDDDSTGMHRRHGAHVRGWVGKCSLPSMIPSSEHRGLVRAEERSGARVERGSSVYIRGWAGELSTRDASRRQGDSPILCAHVLAMVLAIALEVRVRAISFAHTHTHQHSRALPIASSARHVALRDKSQSATSASPENERNRARENREREASVGARQL